MGNLDDNMQAMGIDKENGRIEKKTRETSTERMRRQNAKATVLRQFRQKSNLFLQKDVCPKE